MNDPTSPATPADLRRLGAATGSSSAIERNMTELAESLPGAVFQLASDADNRIRYRFVSGRAREVLGVDRQAILDDPLIPAALVIPEDSAILFKAYRDSARDMKVVSADVRIRRPDGALRWVRTFATPRRVDDALLWDGYWNDVTDEVEARERLQRSEARLRAIVDTVPGVLFQLRQEPDGGIAVNYLSQGTEAMTGVAHEELMSDFGAFLRVVHPDDHAVITESLRSSLQDLGMRENVVRVNHTDGTQHWIKNIIAPRRLDGGQIVWDGITVDMTAQKLTEAALERTEGRLRDITDSLPGVVFQMVYGTDGSARVAHVSEGIGELIGIERDVASTDLAVLIGNVLAEDQPLVIQRTREMARNAGTLHIEFRVRHARSGEVRWILARSAGRRMADGSVVSNGFWQDITDLKTLQADAIRARDEARQAERQLRVVMDTVPGAVYQYHVAPNLTGTYKMISDQGVAMFGRTREDIIGTPNSLLYMVHKQDQPKLIGAFVEAVRSGGNVDKTYRSTVAEGRMAWLRTRAQPIPQPDGGVAWSGFTMDVTEDVEAQQRLQATEQRLREITESLPGVVYRSVVEGGYGVGGRLRYTDMSEGTQAVYGLPREAVLRDSSEITGRMAVEDLVRIGAEAVAALKTGQHLQADFRFNHPDGRQRWLRAYQSPPRMVDGDVVAVGYTTDVTAEHELQEQAAQATRELILARDAALAAEQRLREINQSLPGAVYRLVIEGGLGHNNPVRYTDMSDGALRLYGIPRSELVRDSTLINRRLHPNDLAQMAQTTMAALKSGQQYQTDFRYHHPDGRTRWLRAYQSPPQQVGADVVLVGYTADVTAEHEAKERADEATRQLVAAHDAAQAAETRLRAIFDYNRICLVMIDEERRFSNANPALRELLMIDHEDEFTRDFPKFSPEFQPDGRPSMEKAMEVIAAAFAEGYHRFDWMHQTRSGEPRPCEIGLTRVMLGGRPHLFATMTDLRERLRDEAALREATEAAQAASRAKTDFLANMSHEIRTPMNAIVGLTHLGLTSRDPERLRDYLAKIDLSAKSLLQIINDILDFSKIEAGKLSLESAPFDLYAVLDNLSDMLNLRAAEKGLELLFAVEPGLQSQLVGDSLRLGQVLLNLTGNAIKFTERGQVVVRVKTVKKGRDFLRLRFEVTDTGIGLSAEQIGRLFESFSQADSSTTRRYGGTGLGLAISQRLVDLMDGEIEVDSEPGRGSTFRFTARFGLAPAGKAAARGQMPGALRGMRVLVVDDNATAVAILQTYLESFGFQVGSASSGQQAVAAITAAEAQPYRLVVMDWQMPGMNGIEAARRIREIAHPEPAVIIMVTAFGREEVERQAKTAGLDGFLIKPVNPSVLLDTILDAFGKDAALPPPAATAAAQPPALAGRRVLLVEDNEINQEVARELLQRAGVHVDLAVNGREAVDAAAAHDYDAVLMDVQMPIMDGLEATRRIRALGSPRATVPIIAMTANAMAEDRQRCLEAGMNDHLGKPVDVARLHALLSRWTQGGAPVAVVPAPLPPVEGDAGEPETDFATAVRQMADSQALWARLAARYLASDPVRAVIEPLLAAGDRAGAHRAAHSLKGVAAALGLLALRRAAAEAEQHLVQPGVAAEEVLAALSRADETARERIRQHLASISGA